MRISDNLFNPIVDARKRMGAQYITKGKTFRPEALDWPEGVTDIATKADEITQGPNKEVVVKGKFALLFIQDTGHSRMLLEQNPEESKKYHFYHCNTLEGMMANNRFQRYVATVRADGLFTVHTREQMGGSEEMEARLSPCGNCLKMNAHRGPKSSFDLSGFLSRKPNTNTGRARPMPDALDTDRRPSGYSSDWDKISRKVRETAGWRCRKCDVDLGSDRDLLHVHHLNGVKSDNSLANLQALCIECHSRQPNHNMLVKSDDRARLAKLRLR